MQVVGLDVAEDIGLEYAVSAFDSVLSNGETIGIVGVDGAEDTLEVEIRTDGRPTRATRYPVDETVPSQRLGSILDSLADAGTEYAFVDAAVSDSIPVVTIGSNPGTRSVASVSTDALDDTEGLASLRNRIDDLEPYETLGSLVRAIQTHQDSPKAGAIATFTGRVRAENLEAGRTTHLEYEKYEDVADAEMEAIRRELTERDSVYEVLLHHNTGIVPAEADAVYVVVLAGHRQEAFRAVEDGIDLLKERVPIFKKEVTESGEYWAHDRP